MGSQSQLTPPHSLQENEHPSVVSGCSWHMPERTQSDLAGLPVSSSAHAGKAQRKPGEVPWWNVLISLPVWVSSLNWCLCLAAAFIPKTTVTHREIRPRTRDFSHQGWGWRSLRPWSQAWLPFGSSLCERQRARNVIIIS